MQLTGKSNSCPYLSKKVLSAHVCCNCKVLQLSFSSIWWGSLVALNLFIQMACQVLWASLKNRSNLILVQVIQKKILQNCIVLSKLTGSNSWLWHQRTGFLSCHQFHRPIPCSVLIQAVLQLLVYLLFHLMRFYVQLRILTDTQIPPELLLVPYCTAGYPYGSKSSVKGMPHPSQTISGSCSNIIRANICYELQ